MPDLSPPLIPTQRPVSPERKRAERRSAFVYGGLLSAIVLVILGTIAWFVWAGLVFPGVVGEAGLPEPRHVVRPTSGLEGRDFNRLLGQRLSERIQRREGPPYSVRFSEGELSGFFLSVVPGVTSQDVLRLSSGQVALSPGELEATFVFDAPPFRFPWRLRVEPTGQAGVLHLETKDARLGRIHLPSGLAPGLLGLFLRYDPRDISLRLGEHALVGVRATNRTLELLFE